MEANLRLKIDWAGLIVGSTSPRGTYNWRGDLTEGFLRSSFGGLIFGGTYTRRGLLSEFYGMFDGAPIYNNIIDSFFNYRLTTDCFYLHRGGEVRLPSFLHISL